MKFGLFPSLGVLGTLLFFLASQGASASSSLLLSEVSIAGESTSDEYIELYNTGDSPLDISSYQLRKRTSSGSESSIKVFPKDSIIPARGFFLWANNQGKFKSPLADTETSSSTLANNNSIGLFSSSGADGLLIDSVAWGTGSLFAPTTPTLTNPDKNTSLTRDITSLAWTNTSVLTPTNTTGQTWVPPLPEPSPSSPSDIRVRFNEILPDPESDEATDEFIELWNDSSEAIDISGFVIRDGSKTSAYTFPEGTVLPENEYLVLKRVVSKIALNNTEETLSLFENTGLLVDTVYYKKSKVGISLNRVGESLRGGTSTPGSKNELNTLPETKERVPKNGYRNVPVLFDARGRDSDGGALKYTWDFGDGRKSYKKETSHTYQKNGTYHITLTTSDDKDDVTEIFSVKIESFPEPDIRIVALVPNPEGSDTDHEWLLIENRGKKNIDLQGFSIATGSTEKKLVNHPINDSFVIPAKGEKRLTRKDSRFTLPNKKGRIELRTPDGETLQEIKYKEDQNIPEDMVYRKEKGQKWQWQQAKRKDQREQLPNTPEATLPEVVISNEAPLDTEAAAEQSPKEEEAPMTITPEKTKETALLEQQVLGVTTEIPSEYIAPAILPEKTPGSFFLLLERFFISLNARLNAWQNKD